VTRTTPEKVAIPLRILKSPCCEIEIAGRMIKRIRDEEMCDGVHVMAIGREGSRARYPLCSKADVILKCPAVATIT